MSENPETPFLLYAGEDERVHVNVLVHAETIWLPLAQLAERFTVDKSGISRLLKNIYETGELSQEATVADFATVEIEGGYESTVSKMEAVQTEGELVESTTTEDFSIVRNEGGSDWTMKQMKTLGGKAGGTKNDG